MALTRKVNGKEYEVVRFIMKNLNISQGAYGEYSHVGVPALDICGKDTGIEETLAPCRMKYICSDTAANGNACWFQSVDKVLMADGTIDYLTMMVLHDNDISDIKRLAAQGYVFSQWEPFGDEGISGLASGNHAHLEFAKGKFKGMYSQNKYGTWHLPGSTDIDKIAVIDGCTVYNRGQPVYSGAKMDWKLSNEIPGIDKVTSTIPLPTGGTPRRSTWVKENGKWVYYNKSGVKVTRWNEIGGKWYWFDAAGNAAEGWREITYKDKKCWFYFVPDKCNMLTGWQTINYKNKDCTFYFDKNGVMQTGKQTIDGRQYRFDSNGVLVEGDIKNEESSTPDADNEDVLTIKKYLCGVDVSNYQPEDFDFTPYDFAILRCAWGTNLDLKFNAYADKLEELGIPYGVYIYSYSLKPEDGLAEAEFTLDAIKDRNITCGVWLDLEYDDYKYNHAGLTKENQTGVMNNFCQKVYDAGYYVGVYSGPAYMKQYLPEINWPLWLAWWGVEKEDIDTLEYADKVVLHQYRGDPLDLDYAYVNLEELANHEPEKTGCGCCENCKCNF